jgi:hypothetical protein
MKTIFLGGGRQKIISNMKTNYANLTIYPGNPRKFQTFGVTKHPFSALKSQTNGRGLISNN